MLVRNCVKRAIAYNPPVAYGTAKSDNVSPRKNNISHNKYVMPANLRLTSCEISSKYLTKLIQAFEEAEQEFLSNLSPLKNNLKTDEEVLSQDIGQNVSNKSSLSECDNQDSALSLKMTEKVDSSIASTDILEKYFAMCNTILSDDAQLLINHESIVESSEEQDDINEIQEKSLISKNSIPLVHKLTLILPRCNCATSKFYSRYFGSNTK